MKITRELENKIKNCVDKKYAEEVERLKTKLNDTKERKADLYVNLAEVIVKEHPEFEAFFTCNRFVRRTVSEGARSIFFDIVVGVDKDVKQVSDELAEIYAKKKEEIENFTIKISYGKTFDDIKATFAEYGMDF